MRVERLELGWDQPLLESAGEWLAQAYETGTLGGGIDLSGVLLVTPGRRFARELLAELVTTGEKRGRWVSPGRVITPGELCGELLGDSEGNVASGLFRGMAWGRALREADGKDFEAILKRRPADDAAAEWLRLGMMLDATVGELARELILPREVPERCPELKQFGEEAKWEAIERVRVAYLGLLGESGLEDGHQSHLVRLNDATGADLNEREVVLVGIVELDRASRAALARSGRSVRALVFGGPESAAWVDELGCVRADGSERRIGLRGEAIEFAEDFDDAARRTIGRVAAWTEEHRGLTARDVSVCAPEAAMSRALRVGTENVPGLEFHDAAGEPVGARSIVKLLARVMEHAREGNAETLARLAKRPEIERLVSGRIGETKWLRRVDESGVTSPGARGRDLIGIPAAVGGLVDGLLGLREGIAPISEQLMGVRSVLERVYDGMELPAREAQAAEQIALAMAELEGSSAMFGRVSAWRAIELLLGAIEGGVIAEDARRGSVELLGWLEAAVDRSPYVVIAGLNEGMVPRGKVEDPLLPEGVRWKLGMPNGETRAARDAFLLEGMVRSREKTGGLWAVVAKRDDEGNPLKPSRFVFACGEEEALARVKRLTSDVSEAPRFNATNADAAAKGDLAAFPLAPTHAMEPPTSVRATAFAEYIHSPYVFFLKHVARVCEVEESAGEIDPLAIGTALHDVLKSFRASGLTASTRAEEIEEWALDGLRAEVDRMPTKKLAAVRDVQIEVAKRRLRTFARVQAGHAAKGWRPVETEWEAVPEASLDIGGVPIRLRGRIDRIDRRGDEWLVLDYKTGEKPINPEKKHFKKEWCDLQLPLYAAIWRMSKKQADWAKVGYFLLPRESEKGEVAIAGWGEAEFVDAERRAKEILAAVLRGEFGLGEDTHGNGAIARLCGVTLLETGEEGEE